MTEYYNGIPYPETEAGGDYPEQQLGASTFNFAALLEKVRACGDDTRTRGGGEYYQGTRYPEDEQE